MWRISPNSLFKALFCLTGGVISLFTGSSVMSVFELIVWIVAIPFIIYKVWRMRSRRRNRVGVQ